MFFKKRVSDVRLGTCMMDFRGFFPLYPYLGLGLSHPGFIADLVAQLADAANGDRFAMLFMAIDGQQDIALQRNLKNKPLIVPWLTC